MAKLTSPEDNVPAVTDQSAVEVEAPILRSLRGILTNANPEDYRVYLTVKYLSGQ